MYPFNNDAIPQPAPSPRGPDLDFGGDPSALRNSGRTFAQVGADGQVYTGTPGGQSHNSGVMRVDTTQTDSWKQTGLNNYGSPVSALDRETTVEIDGVRSSIKGFMAAGMLEQLQDGSFARPAPQGTDTPPGADKGAYEAVVGASTIPEEAERAMVTAFANVHPSTVEGALHSAMEAASRTDFSEESLHEVAKQIAATGKMDLGAAQEHLKGVHRVFEEDMKRAVFGAGVDPADFEGFVEFVRMGHQRELKEAMQAQLFNRRTDGYRALAERFLRDVSPAEVPGSYRSWNGKKDLVVVNGIEMPVEIAAKLGLIR